MRIRQVEVHGLFDYLTHVIPLNQIDRITFIHGKNGLGKTILLKMIDGLFNANYAVFRSVPFKKLRVIFDNDSHLEVSKNPDPERTKRHRLAEAFKITVSFFRQGGEKKYLTLPHFEPQHREEVAQALGALPFLARMDVELFRHMETREQMSLDEAYELYADRIPNKAAANAEDNWLADLIGSLSVYLIGTERLAARGIADVDRHRVRGRRNERFSVVRYSHEISKNIQVALAESAALTQKLDRTFPARLVHQREGKTMTEDEIRNRLSELEGKRNQLKAVGLLDKVDDMEFMMPEKMEEGTRGVMTVYVQDVAEKLGVFDRLAERIRLFQSLINSRFEYKQLAISKDDGFEFNSQDGQKLSPSDLSSGEQHELVLFYELLFKVPPNALIMIDEPELSLHSEWQVRFLSDLQQITRLSEFDTLIATHSPQIINARWDLTVELAGPAT